MKRYFVQYENCNKKPNVLKNVFMDISNSEENKFNIIINNEKLSGQMYFEILKQNDVVYVDKIKSDSIDESVCIVCDRIKTGIKESQRFEKLSKKDLTK